MTRRQALLALTAVPNSLEPSSYILAEMPNGRILQQDWPVQRPLSFGSLMKPFVTLAYGAANGFVFPEFDCTACWKPDGHGRLPLHEAMALSCNSYFLALARACPLSHLESTAAIFGFPAPPANPEFWIGLGPGWPVAPAALVRAYGELLSRAPKQLLRGLHLSAQRGTARALGLDAFAKTGTGPCAHSKQGSGDGYAIALFPAEAPRRILLAACHNRPGSETARAAGRLIRQGNFSLGASV